MKRFIATALLAGLTSTAFAAPVVYQLDPSHTYPSFELSHMGFSIQNGRFDKSSGTITLDAEKKTGSVDISIDARSLNSGWEKRDAHVKGPDFFNTEKFPTMTFKSNKLVFEGEKLVAVDGNFTLLGVTKPLTLAVSNFKCDMHPMMKKLACGANASATIKRSEFGMRRCETEYCSRSRTEIRRHQIQLHGFLSRKPFFYLRLHMMNLPAAQFINK
jgi:polyisoprenoid-binding protein YceI